MDASMNHAPVANTALPRSASFFRQAAAFLTLLLVAAGFSGCDKLKARDLLNKGVQSFKNGQYDAAVEDFKQAKDLDPTLLNARLYLATAYASQYIPGAPSEQNRNIGRQDVAGCKDILNTNADKLNSIRGYGSNPM